MVPIVIIHVEPDEIYLEVYVTTTLKCVAFCTADDKCYVQSWKLK